MNKWLIAGIVAGVALGAVLFGGYLWRPEESQRAKIYRVGILSGLDYFAATTDGFKKKMTDLGYVEGKTIMYDVQKTPSPVGNQAVIKKFVDQHVDLILAFPTEPSLEAKELTKGTNIPIISANAVMEGSGLVEGDNFREPGGNLTGVRYPGPAVAARRLEIFHELAPKAKRVFVPYLKGYPSVPPALAKIEPLAASLGLTIEATPFESPPELQAFLEKRAKGTLGMDIMLEIPEPIGAIPAFTDVLFAFAEAYNIPVGGSSVEPGSHGSLFLLAPDAKKVGELAAPIADKIFKGIGAGTMPVIAADSDLKINVTVAKRLGLTVSDALLSQAVQVVR